MDVFTTAVFDEWFRSLKDLQGRARIRARIDRLSFGHLGDFKALGSGIIELRIFSGPGYRVYLKFLDTSAVVLLAGGDKESQKADIMQARLLARNLEE
jgi:putative addiction module killer protein